MGSEMCIRDRARLEMALQSYAVDFIQQRGFTFVQPPVMMNRSAYEGVTDLSDFETGTVLILTATT